MDPAILLRGIYSKEIKHIPTKDLYMNVYSSFIHISPNWKPRSPLTKVWIKTVVKLHNGNAVQQQEVMIHATTRISFKNIKRVRSLVPNSTNCMNPFILSFTFIKIIKGEKKITIMVGSGAAAGND